MRACCRALMRACYRALMRACYRALMRACCKALMRACYRALMRACYKALAQQGGGVTPHKNRRLGVKQSQFYCVGNHRQPRRGKGSAGDTKTLAKL